ncbi:MAG: hypothetical protein H0T53_07125, partial [Herpetosiphonaceae bacterium]|nr:hypothetical protein [Herpetosiphonaceae bacterium]
TVTNGLYLVRLHFAELLKTAAGQRIFNVQQSWHSTGDAACALGIICLLHGFSHQSTGPGCPPEY